MKVVSKVTLPEFRRFMFEMVYRKPVMIFLNVIGVLMLAVSIIGLAGLDIGGEKWGLINMLRMAFGLVIIGYLPFSVYRSATKNYNSNLRIQEEIVYDFAGDKVTVSGSSFTGEKDLNKCYKIVELKDWFLLYENNIVFNLLPKKSMTGAEVNELRAVFRNLSGAVIKKLK